MPSSVRGLRGWLQTPRNLAATQLSHSPGCAVHLVCARFLRVVVPATGCLWQPGPEVREPGSKGLRQGPIVGGLALREGRGHRKGVRRSRGACRGTDVRGLAVSVVAWRVRCRTLLADLACEGLLGGLGHERFVERLTHYYAELNAVHPFREGNGSAQRAFLGQIAKTAAHPIAWARLDAECNVHLARESHRGSDSALREMLHDHPDARRAVTALRQPVPARRHSDQSP
jgi:hypothetical protein